MIREKLQFVLDNFLLNRAITDKATKTLSTWPVVVDELPVDVQTGANLPRQFLVVGSIGQGLLTEIPWVCVFDTEITRSAQNGYYICYLFKSDMTGFYLSLNQGWYQYQTTFGVARGKTRIRENTERAQRMLRSTGGFSFEPIDLLPQKLNGQGYELGNICSKYYETNNIPEDLILINDLRNLMGIYSELKGLVGLSILDIENRLNEEEFQTEAQNAEPVVFPPGPVNPPAPTIPGRASTWPRKPGVAAEALRRANHCCEQDNLHLTFVSARTQLQFMEAHHLIPMEFQGEFNVSLDVPENVVSLCPNCHRAFHNAETALRIILIQRFFELREQALQTRGIYITSERLQAFYVGQLIAAN